MSKSIIKYVADLISATQYKELIPFLPAIQKLVNARSHNQIEGATSLSFDDIRKSFGTQTKKHINSFIELNNKYQIFEVIKCGFYNTYNLPNIKTCTDAYRVSPWFKDIWHRAVKLKYNNRHIILDIADIQMKGTGLSSRNIRGDKVKHKVFVSEYLKIDVQYVHDYIYNELLSLDPDYHTITLLDNILEIVEDFNRYDKHYGYINMLYVQSLEGRIYTLLQCLPRKARKILLHGYTNYDVVNCQCTLLSQMVNDELPVLYHYTQHSDEMRDVISVDTGVDVKSVKGTVLSMMFGARLNKYGDIYIKILEPYPVYNKDKLIYHKYTQELKKDILEAERRITKSKVNILTLKFRKVKKTSLMAHMLQGAEAYVLYTILNNQDDNVVMSLHDGVYVRNEINIPILESHIQEQTTFNLHLT